MQLVAHLLAAALLISAIQALAINTTTTPNAVAAAASATTTDVAASLDPATAARSADDTDDLNRKKKHTTTFCVEIRPSSPYQKPFQVCEPKSDYGSPQHQSGYYNSEPAYNAPAPHKEPAPSYGKKQEYASGPAKPAAAYSSPGSASSAPAYGSSSSKTYPAPAPAPSNSYSPGKDHAAPAYQHTPYTSLTYRNANEDQADDIPADEDHDEDDRAAEEEEHSDHMRSAYGVEYGAPPMAYISPISKLKKKILSKKLGPAHNGLVISCQPSLAGYASPVHSYPSASYGPSYRSSTPGSYQRPYAQHAVKQPASYAAYSIQRPAYPQQQTYGEPMKNLGGYAASGGYKQEVAHSKPAYSGPAFSAPSYYSAPAAPSYGQQAASGYGASAAPASGYGASAAPVSSYGASASGYGAPASSYGAPASGSYGPAESSAVSGYEAPKKMMPQSYSQVPQVSSYSAPAPVQAPAYGPAGGHLQPQMQPEEGAHLFTSTLLHQASHGAMESPQASPAYQQKAQGYGGVSSGYAPAPAGPSYSAPKVTYSKAPAYGNQYAAPLTYRSSESVRLDDKEKHTINKMTELSKERAAGGLQWESESADTTPDVMRTATADGNMREAADEDSRVHLVGMSGGWSPLTTTNEERMRSSNSDEVQLGGNTGDLETRQTLGDNSDKITTSNMRSSGMTTNAIDDLREAQRTTHIENED